ncbi:ABC transporter ATP-binding protein [Psychrobacillus vulpis]|uniref:ABC transporter ATP-binding protein n=1 Tax=Psychrobacillus vulpis TaxID=2325572 RepID=A0A544TJ78_9BACI|nr:ABC transporter ATP-binding protein [Psychrobacillus vulpis]TQR17512.1 ABC transporter ATP-binding protein [Psychrobacillus vulpis]
MSQPILTVDNLEVAFSFPDGEFSALQGISFSVEPNEVVGIVGESGCGKSLTSLSVMGILPRNANIINGEIQLNGKDLIGLSNKEWQSLRGNKISMIFQEPMTSLNPLLTIGKQISEVLKKHTKLSKEERKKRTIEVMKEVGLPRTEELYASYPHQLSGGMRQRIVIAIALIGEANLIIADEPTTALDVTIQAQILELFREIKRKRSTSMLFISHDWGVIRQICDRVFVMYAGRIIEQGTVNEIVNNPKHPYTKGLILSIPDHKKRGKELHTIPGRVPTLKERKGGCLFVDRCANAMKICKYEYPKSLEIGEQKVSCHLYTKEAEVI